ncbi:glycosyltransferase family 4 protein, partial [bacterium]|nr:glycosyltransferase family 4 protein [bacterium]
LLSNMLQARTEIIHGHCYMYFPLDVSALASFVKKIPLVVNPYLAELGPPSIAGRIYRRTVGRLIMNAEMVIAISQYEKHLIQQWGYCPKAMEIIPPGVDLKEFADVKHNIYQKYGLGKNDYIVLFVGRIDWMKGVDILIEAAPEILKRVPETKIVVVGPDFGMKRRLEYMVREKKLERNIVFLDALSRSDVISAFKNATVFVLPTRYEAFGIVLIEAMAAGLPVVASSCSAIPYVVEHGENGLLFPTNSYNDLAGCVIRLLRDTELRRKMGEAGYSEVRHKYDWQKNITRLEDLYRYLLR